MASMYQKSIEKILEESKHIEIDPRHIEGYMRLEHSTLDGLSPAKFRKEVLIGIACVKNGGIGMAESNAKSFGL